MELDIHGMLARLAQERPIFHSEADFQHALAWELRTQLRESRIRLEVPIGPLGQKSRRHVDILVNNTCAIELKYKTVRSQYALGEERFDLRSHGAQPLGRHDFVKDIERLEGLVLKGPCVVGYAIMLTNDDYYWKGTGDDTIDGDFRICDGQTIGGTLQWADPGRRWLKGREEDIALWGRYLLSWSNYSDQGFRYLVVEVRRVGVGGV